MVCSSDPFTVILVVTFAVALGAALYFRQMGWQLPAHRSH